MTPYLNLNGNSNILAYEITEDSILVIFKSGRWRNYLYSATRLGKAVVEKMQIYAIQGHGLNSFISSVVKDRYARKW